MILDLLNGFRPRFLFFDLEDYASTFYTINDGASANDPSEYYQLVQCCDDKPCLMDGKPVRFKFTGKMSNNIHPDDLIGLVLTTITDINQNDYTGCFKLVEAECYLEHTDFAFEDFFFKYTFVKTCKECMPEPVVVQSPFSKKPIYAIAEYNGLDAERVETTMCDYAETTHHKMMSTRHGVVFCCDENLMDLKIDLEILKMDLVSNNEICCP